jgi:hypothetical protein
MQTGRIPAGCGLFASSDNEHEKPPPKAIEQFQKSNQTWYYN